jgi:hypothetical protein
MHITREEF